MIGRSPGEGTRVLLEAIRSLHECRDRAGVEQAAVDAIEHALTGAASALFSQVPGLSLVCLRAAGHRWRTAERQAPAWLSRLTGGIGDLVRRPLPLCGQLTRSAPPGCPGGEDGLSLAQIPVKVDRRSWGAVVVLWPGSAEREADLWLAEHLVDHLGLALRHFSPAAPDGPAGNHPSTQFTG